MHPLWGSGLLPGQSDFDLLLSSSAKRARRTAECIAAETGYDEADIVYDKAIYDADLSMLLSLIRQIDDSVHFLALVGHNHVITECAEWLTGRRIVNIPTSGIAAISFTAERWDDIDHQAGVLEFFDYPKLLPGTNSAG